MDSTVKESRFQGGEGRHAKRISLVEVEESMSGRVDAKALLEDLQSLGFTPSQAKPEMGKDVGRRRTHSYDDRAKRVRVTCRGGIVEVGLEISLVGIY